MVIHRMKLEEYGDGFQGNHPLGSMVCFYPIKSTDESGKVSKKWVWAYENCDSKSFDTLKDAVCDWRSTMNLPL